MYKFLLVAALLITAAASALAQTTSKSAAAPDDSASEQAVLRVTQEWLDADERHDRAALDKIVASDFVGTAPRGRTVYKRDIIPEAGSTGGHALNITTQDVEVRVYGETAIVTGRGIGKTPERAAQGELKFTVVFVKRDRQWQLVAAHFSPVPKE
jgi:ketosteroid isomerase-like protein